MKTIIFHIAYCWRKADSEKAKAKARSFGSEGIRIHIIGMIRRDKHRTHNIKRKCWVEPSWRIDKVERAVC